MNNNSKTTLRVLLVLTFIGSGFSFLGYFMMALVQPQMQQIFEANPGLVPEQMVTAYTRLFEIPRLYFAVASLLYLLSLVGAILMWHLRPSGFHCYTLAQLLLLVVPLLFLGRGFLGIGDVMFTALFITAYYFLLRALGVFGHDNDTNQPPTDSDWSSLTPEE